MQESLLWTGFAAVLAALIWRSRTRSARIRERHIANYVFPGSVARKIRETYPHLEPYQVDLVISGLREFFSVALAANGRMVAMPSKVVDVAWHEFIVCTRAYQQFCMAALGRFLHHTPAEAMPSPAQASEGIRRAWRLSCARQRIDPKSPSRLPLLFAIDQELNILDGYHYATDCSSRPEKYCATAIGCSAGCGGSSSSSWFSGDGDAAASSGADGGGAGGGGCGGD